MRQPGVIKDVVACFAPLMTCGLPPVYSSVYGKITNIMGVITIEIPQSVNRNYRIVSEDSAEEVLSKVEQLVKQENKIDDNDILGLWADRDESVEEIARDLRRKTNDRSLRND